MVAAPPMSRPYLYLPFFGWLAACSGSAPTHHPAPAPVSSVEHAVVTPLSFEPALEHAPPAQADELAPEPGEPGSAMGRYQLTYYWVADEAAIGGRPAVTLRDRKCKKIARVSKKFRRALLREGTGKLSDGRVVNVSGGCRCGSRCFLVTDEDSPYGLGAKGRSLEPFRSIAAPTAIKVGTVLYVPELDGLTVPGSSGLGGTVHNGCVVADDRGGGVTGRQLDLFTGKRTVYRSFFKRHKIKKVSVFRAGDRCDDLEAEGDLHRGDG